MTSFVQFSFGSVSAIALPIVAPYQQLRGNIYKKTEGKSRKDKRKKYIQSSERILFTVAPSNNGISWPNGLVMPSAMESML